MRKVISVRLKEDLVRQIDSKCKDYGFDSRTEFMKEAIKFYLNRKHK
ncbi:ribbon-helix-helix protein, CopG family [Acidianus sulfidivorans JP7]|uniref:CopG family transcriptional regulator n=1 Tax=Acidianus sulfidivorans JP7 TaxID=619593 RepID=A0A2U9INF5_9CREN|nr:ribbon-helix-helix domain-containing protein [Acidianus sulfidivorans]AWR97553.1 ribbon-helix-helix protein, CopG family [Acidianus sulfidivorans JP7]